ncbi:MAG: thioredoxin family protein [Phycisphaerae bacterium]|nr:thioredoxin family protein [Phycisphaerae bacterium]
MPEDLLPQPATPSRPPRRPWRTLAVVLLVGGVIALISFRMQHRFRPTLHWETDSDAAFALAAQRGQPVLIVFTQPNCVYCERLEKRVLETPAFESLADGRAVLAMLDVQSPKHAALLERYGGSGTPTVVMTNSAGQRIGDYQDFGGQGTSMVLWLERMLLGWERSRVLITTQPETQPTTLP